MSKSTKNVEPDASRLPKCVTAWLQPHPATTYEDQSQLLVAVPVCNRFSDGWHYEYEVVTVCCDSDYFSLEDANGDAWGWSYDDIDFFAVLNGNVTQDAKDQQ
jgi:hypothetical protein